jgi:hypothetical protein
MNRQTVVLLLVAGAAVALVWYFQRNGTVATPKAGDASTVKPGQTGGPVVTVIEGTPFNLNSLFGGL